MLGLFPLGSSNVIQWLNWLGHATSYDKVNLNETKLAEFVPPIIQTNL